ncbi:uncharacterized protein LOC111615635 [Centruroides sculpturatus]|uniref:uncharacterized protein LOC111615635 n=1 Tax=Centruroides sculpturatus TaxID=218467 RepID=UPI000C6E8CB7|nr:uncharacterized protein LOC111615635 [Centruroides sculpturatus]
MNMWLKTGKHHSMDAGTSFTTTIENEPDVSTKKSSGDSDIPIRKKQKYNEEYTKFGFTWIGNENEPKWLCIECEHVMHNSSLNPAKLKRHLETNHPTLQNKIRLCEVENEARSARLYRLLLQSSRRSDTDTRFFIIYTTIRKRTYFAGLQIQRGYGFFVDLFRKSIPILSEVGKYLGSKALKFASNVDPDVIGGKSFKESTKNRFKHVRSEIKKDVLKKV